jgi:hypothetical protein
MNAVFIAGIEVRLALKSRSDALPVCRLGIGAGQISVRIHRPIPICPSRCQSGSAARPVWPPRPRSPVPEPRAGPQHRDRRKTLMRPHPIVPVVQNHSAPYPAPIAAAAHFVAGSCTHLRSLRHLNVDAELIASPNAAWPAGPSAASAAWASPATTAAP